MMFNSDESEGKKEINDSLKAYFFQRCDITEKEYEQLIMIARDLPTDLLKNRLKMMADYFFRLKSGDQNAGIHNEFAYAKKIILSDSFFENQRVDHSIPSVTETKKYLDTIRKRRHENPGVDQKAFHKKVETIKNLYEITVDQSTQNKSNKRHKDKIQEKTATVLKKLEEEERIKAIESEIAQVYKDLVFCELEYRLFQRALLNIYLYHNEAIFQRVVQRIQEKKKLFIKDLSEIRQTVLNQLEKEHENDL